MRSTYGLAYVANLDADYCRLRPKKPQTFQLLCAVTVRKHPARTVPRNRRRAARHRPGHFHGGISNSSAPAIRER
jgi:hypothetical protein